MSLPRTPTEVATLVAEQRANGARDAFLGVRLSDDFDPRVLLRDPAAHDVVASYERSELDLALVAVGVAGRAEAPLGEGPASVRRALRRLFDAPREAEEAALRPRALGGFRFHPARAAAEPWQAFGPGWLAVPRLLLVRDGDVRGIVLAPGTDAAEAAALVAQVFELASAQPQAAESGPAPLRLARSVDESAWRRSVANIAAEVRAGLYEKAVLAASARLEADAPISIGSTLERLRGWYPACHLFTMRANGATFLGASPELLVSLEQGRVQALGLAGSTARGADEAEDERLGRALLESAKDRIEHETTVRAIRERLEGATEHLRAPNQPRLRKLRNIQHLATEVTARVREGVDVLDLVERLHPTPAVCGWPTAAARRVIEAHEDFDRGWYAGPVGWVDADGEGQFAVALRSAVVREREAWLFAGNGIMGDSDPDAELAEVQLKFRPLAESLGGAPEEERA